MAKIMVKIVGYFFHFLSSYIELYSDNSIKNTVLRPNWQYKASTAEMAENRYS